MNRAVKKYLDSLNPVQDENGIGLVITVNGKTVALDFGILNGNKWEDWETGESGYTPPIKLQALKKMLKSL